MNCKIGPCYSQKENYMAKFFRAHITQCNLHLTRGLYENGKNFGYLLCNSKEYMPIKFECALIEQLKCLSYNWNLTNVRPFVRMCFKSNFGIKVGQIKREMIFLQRFHQYTYVCDEALRADIRVHGMICFQWIFCGRF